MIEITAPAEPFEDAGEGVEGLLEAWLVDEHDRVAAGQAVADAIVVKTSFQISAPCDGTLAEIVVGAGDTFPAGAVLALVEEDASADSGPVRCRRGGAPHVGAVHRDARRRGSRDGSSVAAAAGRDRRRCRDDGRARDTRRGGAPIADGRGAARRRARAARAPAAERPRSRRRRSSWSTTSTSGWRSASKRA